MKKRHFEWLKRNMGELLEQFDEDGGNPECCDEQLHERMAKAQGTALSMRVTESESEQL